MKAKIKLTILLMTMMIIGTVSSVSAMDPRVSKSGGSVTYISSTNKSKANGYITSTSYHYANVALVCMGTQLAISGRKWGYNKVSTSTKYVKRGDLGAAFDYYRVYYGF